eukprot:m.75438 g.75438  ORF g.75438 m.75438 type:complete len:213 (+) comp8482_c0_seq1:266-904(+)
MNPWSNDGEDGFSVGRGVYVGSTSRILALGQSTGHLSLEELEHVMSGNNRTVEKCDTLKECETYLMLLEKKTELVRERLKREQEELFSFILSKHEVDNTITNVHEVTDQLSLLANKKERLKNYISHQNANDTLSIPFHKQRQLVRLLHTTAEDLGLFDKRSKSLAKFRKLHLMSKLRALIELQLVENSTFGSIAPTVAKIQALTSSSSKPET